MVLSPLFFSIVIPAHNEAGALEATISAIADAFARENIADYEILVVNDHSADESESVLLRLTQKYPQLRYVNNSNAGGYGYAVRCGLDNFRGQAVCVAMADLSDAPEDMVVYYRRLKAGAECVFGSRFIKGAKVYDYPLPKLILNRLANWFIQCLFHLPLNDVTNAFKAYRREVIDGIKPLLSAHFNLTVEMPLKAIIRGYRYEVVPISWRNRKVGRSKFHIQEMGSRYLFIVLYALLEKWLSRGDYHRG